MALQAPSPTLSSPQGCGGNPWQSGVQRSSAGLSQLDAPENSMRWALQLLPVYSNTQEFVCPAGASFSSEQLKPKERHAAFLLHFLDVAQALQDNVGIPPGQDLPPPKQRRRLKAIINSLSPEQYLGVILNRTFGSHHKMPRPFIGFYFKNAEEPPPTPPVQMADCALGLTDDCLPAMVGDDISGLSRAAAWYYYGGVNVAGIHAEDAWLHSINAAVRLPSLNTTLLEDCIEPDGIWALQTSLRLSVCKLWTFAPKQLSAPDLGLHLASAFELPLPCGLDKLLVSRSLSINPCWAQEPAQAALGWELVWQWPGDVIWADRPHAVVGDMALALSWNYALPSSMPDYIRRDLEASSRLRESPEEQATWGDLQRSFALGNPLLQAVVQNPKWLATHPKRHKFYQAAMLLVEQENAHKQQLEHAQRHAIPAPSHIQEDEVDEDQAVKYMCTRCRGSLCCSAYVPQLKSGSSSGSCCSSSSEHGWGMDEVQHASKGRGFDGDGHAAQHKHQHCQQRQQQQQQQGPVAHQPAKKRRMAVGNSKDDCCGDDSCGSDVGCCGDGDGSGPLHERVCAGCVRAGEHVWHVRLISVQACKQAGLQAATP